MTRELLSIALVVAAAGPLVAQTVAPAPAPPAAPRFEVASIRVSPEPGPGARGGLTVTKNQARFSLLSLNDYIGIAYDVRLHQIAGPDWLATSRFEIAATIPEGQPPDSLSSMLRALLEDRFALRTHREKREFAVYGLEVMSADKLVKVPDEKPVEGAFTVSGGGSASGISVDLGQGASLTLGNNRFEAKKVTMAMLADTLARFVDRPVVDMTKLEGRYDITFQVSEEDFRVMMMRAALASGAPLPPQVLQMIDTASIAAVPDALKAVGFSLTPKRAPLEVLVIDSMEKLPTDN
jgi:uncharacterized protein (TIGR03435 family)